MDLAVLSQLGIIIKNINVSQELVEKISYLPTYIPSPETHMSARGGSRISDFQNYPWIEEIKKRIEEIAESKTRRFWINLNGKGHWNDWHRHESNRYACVCYLQTPQDSGDILFRKDNIEYSITPYPGLVLIFPGPLEHKVTANNSEELRISIATNLEKYFTP